jgi:hypothetical protein
VSEGIYLVTLQVPISLTLLFHCHYHYYIDLVLFSMMYDSLWRPVLNERAIMSSFIEREVKRCHDVAKRSLTTTKQIQAEIEVEQTEQLLLQQGMYNTLNEALHDVHITV